MILYQLGIWFYALAVRLSSPFNPKAKLFLKGRANLFNLIEAFKAKEKREIIWFHAASLGEFEQGLPIMEQFKKQFPDLAIVVSFFSPSGYEKRKNHKVADFTCYLPIDTQKNASHFLEILQPKLALFIKYEYWYHFLNEAQKRQISIYSVSATFTAGHHFFKPQAHFQRSILKLIKHFFVQTQKSSELLKSININNVSISGDTRFDRVKQTVASPKHYPTIERFKGNKSLLIIGSAWESDMKVLSEFINSNQNLKVIIAPHEIDKRSIQLITKHLKHPFDLYSEGNELKSDILILDTIGMLSDIYQYGDFAYIGGAFGDGLHNILEAVAFGLPVVFGDKGLEKFPEADELVDLGGAIKVRTQEETSAALSLLLEENSRKVKSQICLNYIDQKAGATEHIMSYFKVNGL